MSSRGIRSNGGGHAIIRGVLPFFGHGSEPCASHRIGVIRRALGVLDYILGDFVWADDETVRVLHANKRDYWNISSRGDAASVFPPAESGNPQGLYQLATLYAEGRYVRENRQHAIELMRQSAVLGHKHAQNFLKRDKKAGQG